MKRLILAILFSAPVILSAQPSFFDRADAFFKKYVSDGHVNYPAIKKSPVELNALVKEVGTMRLNEANPGLKAFYINAYNLLVIKQVVELYPIKGPLVVEGFFNKITHTVMGTTMTLDQLEKGTLSKKFPDPRLHFVLVCAAKGCPPLVNYAYKPDVLDRQLTDRTRQVLNLDWFVRVKDSKAEVSQIFNWYEADFLSTTSSVLGFINTYRSKKIAVNSNLTYYEYDWSLNE